MRTITITLPLPSKRLSPNARCHWAAKATAAKAYRLDAYATTICVMGYRRPPRWKDATAKATFYFKQNRRRDRDNLLASLKNAMDGIADANLVENDAGIVYLPVEIQIDKANPRVEIEVSEA